MEELEEDWWNARMEGGRRKLAVKGGFTSTASGSRNPDTKADSWSKEASPIATESTKVEEAAAGKEASSMDAEGGFVMWGVEEQQAVRVEAWPQKRRAVIRLESEETQDYVMERRSCGYPSQEEVEEIGFVPSAVK